MQVALSLPRDGTPWVACVLIGYVRSLRLMQQPYMQATKLIAVGCQSIYIEMSSGDHLARPVLHRAIAGLEPGDVLIVGDGDRLSRNELQTDILLRRIHAKGATLQLLDANDELLPVVPIDTNVRQRPRPASATGALPVRGSSCEAPFIRMRGASTMKRGGKYMGTFVLKGRWFGDVESPERCFKGTVEHAGETEIPLGEQAVVSYEGGQGTPTSDRRVEHGRYNLLVTNMAPEQFSLVSFVRKDGSMSREAEQTDEDQLWGGDVFES
ncbi:recombinase family protein [Deinococcus yavapaiensis]|uniref:Resolvase-like protein n=1 Tax=Deinococcus yavapaiensis KR-236 TaxID=694435 RepID=A0A318SMT3_9DEIO|nr:recombinase family protein [Deinococcus yavapaiensis]PYE53861.1 resolvase-like protein [Deinococcus yavapaiensis KR-236]